MSTTPNNNQQQPNKDETFAARIQSGIATVEAWDDDPSLLAECRLLIPFGQLLPELHGGTDKDSSYFKDDDVLYRRNLNALFLKRLAVHFQNDVMTWVNAPPCVECGQTGDHMKFLETRGPQSQEEQEGQAKRVEVYQCQNCQDNPTTTFARYNSCRKLLETRKGRCGEYANLFGLYCRAVGFETRYVSDWTDHVWIEVLIGDDWIMADSCEGTINQPSMYESGWGKSLNCIIAISSTGVTDVTPRYTRQFANAEFQQRRRQITTSEVASNHIVKRLQDGVRQTMSAKAVQALAKRDKMEQAQLDAYKTMTQWSEAEKHGRGRISGSLEWRVQRNEAGSHQSSNGSSGEPSLVRALCGEQFYPTGSTVRMEVSLTQDIRVSGVPCDVGQPHSVSVVVVDDVHLGCVLQSRCFALWSDVAAFLHSIPLGRIVALKGCTKEEAFGEDLAKQLQILGGFQLPQKPTEGVVFLGRLGAQPEWTKCGSDEECTNGGGFSVEFSNVTRSTTKLRAESKTVPHKVVGRLPETVMPLQTQLLASDAQKRTAFLAHAKDHPNITGYATKDSNPVYLMDNSCFPFEETQGDWTTFHYLPEVLAPEENTNGGANNSNNANLPKFDLPLEDNFFQNLLGPSLFIKSNGTSSALVPTSEALRHTRLVGLYFSAHWCPPCKRFTPMLAEMYEMLKQEHPYHGLEIVFVTSDRSSAEFQQYYNTMPWAAVPFDETRMRPQSISMQYGVRGIPALVILDAVSGQVVASTGQARNEVTQACSRGDAAIEDLFEKGWLGRLPPESIELYNLLKMSSMEGDDDTTTTQGAIDARNAYLTIDKDLQNNPWADKPTFKNLDFGVSAGSEANEEESKPNGSAKLGDEVKVVLTTMLKYLDNAVREPWNPKFRNFKLGNKIVDKATRVDGAIDLICSYGMTIVPTVEDFMISIPLGCDLDAMKLSMTNALE